MNKTYPVPDEVVALFDEYSELYNLRSKYIKLPFSFNKCVKITKMMSKITTKRWYLVYELYPELIGGKIEYISDTREVIMIKD